LSGYKKSEIVELANPLTNDWQYMRPTILISLINVIAQNQKIKDKIAIFEIAKTFIKKRGLLPQQDLQLTIVISNSNFYEVKGLIENIFEILRKKVKWEKLEQNDPIFEIDQSAKLTQNLENIGAVGMVSQNLINHFKIESTLAAAEINLTKLNLNSKIQTTYKPIPKHPPILEDLSAVFSDNVPIDDIVTQIKISGADLVSNVEIIDIYRNEKIGESKKSVAFRITYQKRTKTPTQKEVDSVKNKIIKDLSKNLLAKLRT